MSKEIPATVDSLTVPALLGWLIDQRIQLPTAAIFTGLGIRELDQLSTAATLGQDFQREAVNLLATGAAVGSTVIVTSLALVGHRVLASDIENIDQWTLIANRVKAAGWNQIRTAQVCNEFMDSGRSPSFAAELMTVAEQTGTPVLAYGVGPEITTSTFRDLADAGIRDLDTLDAFRDAGLSLTESIAIAGLGVGFGAVRAAVADDLPRDRWADTLPGLPSKWFPALATDYRAGRELPDPRGILLTAGATWENLYELANNGWGDCPPRVFGSTEYWKHDGLRVVTIADALRAAAAGIGFAEMDRWAAALTLGKGRSQWNDQTMPPLSSHYSGESTVSVVIRLKAAGMKSSWVAEFRASGARNIEDVETMLATGLTNKLSVALRATAGTPIARWSGAPKRFPSVRACLDALRAEQTHGQTISAATSD